MKKRVLHKSWATAILVMLNLSLSPSVCAQEPRFEVNRFELQGNSLLSEQDWRAALATFVGRPIGFSELQVALQAVQALYHARGWRLVTVELPAQSTDQGVITLRAVEPKVQSIEIAPQPPSPSGGFASSVWARRLPALQSGSAPDLDALDANLTQANELPGVRASVAFLPGADAQSIRAVVRAQEQDIPRWSAYLDNSGNRQTGHLRYGISWQHDDVWGIDHQFSLNLTSAPHDESNPQKFSLLPSSRVRSVSASYRAPLPSIQSQLDIAMGYSNVDSGTVGGIFEISGKGSQASVRFSRLLPRVAGWESRWSVGWDWRKYDSQVLFGGFNLASPLTLTPWSVGLSAQRPASAAQPSSWQTYLTAVLHRRDSGDSSAANFAASRVGALPEYELLRYGVAWQGTAGAWDLQAKLDGQASSKMLVAAEQFSAGGAGSVRGFANRGIGGDSGARIQLEATGPRMWESLSGESGQIRPAVFTDAAWTRLRNPTVLELPSSHISSIGVGLLGQWQHAGSRSTSLRLDIAKALSQKTGAAPIWGAVHVSLSTTF